MMELKSTSKASNDVTAGRSYRSEMKSCDYHVIKGLNRGPFDRILETSTLFSNAPEF